MRSRIAVQRLSRSFVEALVVVGSMTVAAALPAHAARATQQAATVITGIVIDSRSRQPLAGASVIVVGSRLGAPTGTDGRVRSGDATPGSRVLFARRIGYASQRQSTSVSTTGVPAYVLPAGATAGDVHTQVIEERCREFFVEGHGLGDRRRYGLTFRPLAAAAYQYGGVYRSQTCFPPDVERIKNPTIAKGS